MEINVVVDKLSGLKPNTTLEEVGFLDFFFFFFFFLLIRLSSEFPGFYNLIFVFTRISRKNNSTQAPKIQTFSMKVPPEFGFLGKFLKIASEIPDFMRSKHWHGRRHNLSEELAFP